MWHNTLMSPMQTETEEEMKMLCKEQDDRRIEGRQHFVVQGGEMSVSKFEILLY